MPTMKDVAKLAEVSVGSVSKYFNGIALKEKTKLAIEKAVKELNYEPNIYAKGLKINRTNTVVLIIPSIWNPFFSELTFHIEKELRKHEIKLILYNSENNIENEIQFITMSRQNKVDGIIAVTYSNIDEYISENLPFVSIDRFFSHKTNFVSSDNYSGGRLATEMLIKHGSKNLAYIGHGSKYSNDTISRLNGFKDYCSEHNIFNQICYNTGTRKEFEMEVDNFIKKFIITKKIDGIFSSTDAHAFYILEKLEDLNISVPEDIQIIGFDGAKSSKREKNYLSTIRQNIEEIAIQSVKILVDTIENKENIENKINIKIPVTFLSGKTTKPIKDL